MSSHSQVRQNVLSRFPLFFPTLLAALALALFRSFSLSAPVQMALEVSLFLVGAGIAHLIFSADSLIQRSANSIVDRVQKWEETAGDRPDFVPLQQSTGEPAAQRAILRQGIFLLLVPLLGFMMLATGRSELGLGVMWGLSVLYFFDVWPFFSAARERVAAQYFPHWAPDTASLMTTIVGAYLVYTFLYTLALLII